MKKAFVEKGMYAICTYDRAVLPRHLTVVRSNPTIKRKYDIPILTVIDNQLKDPFTCKLPLNDAEEDFFNVLGAGTVTGGAVALGIVPPAALLVCGGMALIALGKLAYASEVTSQECNACIINQWILPHKKVKIEQHKAILCYHSKLHCSKGGIIIACESFMKALNIAKKISKINANEMSSNIKTGILTGSIGGPAGSLIDFSLELAFDAIDSIATGDKTEEILGNDGSEIVSGGLTVAESVTTEILPDTLPELKKGTLHTNPHDIIKAGKKGIIIAAINVSSNLSGGSIADRETNDIIKNTIRNSGDSEHSILAIHY